MRTNKRNKFWSWISQPLSLGGQLPNEHQAAKTLIKAVDKGGIPLNPSKVNAIARDLGLEVSTKEPVEATIQRIRAALTRS